MLEESLSFIVNKVNEYIALQASGDATRVQLNALVDQKGDIQVADDKVACTLVSLEEERISKAQYTHEIQNGIAVKKNPPLKFNLYVLFAANPKISTGSTNYGEGLKLISHIIAYFQGTNYFTKTNAPDLPNGIEKLIMEVYSMPIEQQNYMWGALGAKYLPSVLYRMRLVVIDAKETTSSQGVIDTLDVSLEEKLND